MINGELKDVFAVEAFRHVVYLVHLGSLHAAVNLRRLRIAGCGGLPGEIPGIIPGARDFPASLLAMERLLFIALLQRIADPMQLN
ncbi:MAG: hypothetical protein II922_01000 [Succinimonas sp.]|nr:hypothetical protein [Succinimonas sp.]